MASVEESLERVLRSYRVEWYRCPIDRQTLLGLMRRSDAQGWFQAAGHLVLTGCTAALIIYFFLLEQWIAMVVALFFHGTVASNFIYACHELGHGTVFRTKWLNGLFLRVFSVLGWWNFHEYAMSHTYHHIYTLHRRADKEVLLPAEPSVRPLYVLQLFTVNITGGFATRGAGITIGGTIRTAFGGYSVFSTPGWLEDLYANRPEARRRAVNWARLVLAIHVAVAVVSFANGWWIVPILFSLGPDIANWHAYFVGAPMHCGLRDDVPRLSQVRAFDHPRPALGVHLLAHELAPRAPHVRRSAVLQPQEAAPGGGARHAEGAELLRRMAGDARDLAPAAAVSRTTSSTRRCPRKPGQRRPPGEPEAASVGELAPKELR